MSRDKSEEYRAVVERAMVAIRRSQTRRNLARLAPSRSGPTAGRAAPTPVGWPSFDVLDVIEAAAETGVPATVSSVADALNVDQPRASRLVAAAVQAGLVRREADQADGRRAPLVTTVAGQALLEEVHQFRRSTFSAAMAGWSDTERADFARLLARFVEALSRRL